MSVVFHCATIAQGSADTTMQKLAHAVNVAGTQNIIDACRICRVPKLVYTSSASVVYDGKDLHNVDESAPYATRTLDCYTATKVHSRSQCRQDNEVYTGQVKSEKCIYISLPAFQSRSIWC